MNKTIGIFAHVDAGKTTFSEQLLYYTGSIRNIGRVDHKTSFLDSDEIEQKRGITIFADQGIFSYGEDNYYIIDTPGHVDFSAETERAVCALDYAILLVSGSSGVQAHTVTLFRLLKTYGIPTFIFINKTDVESFNLDAVLNNINTKLSSDIHFFSSKEDIYKNDKLAEFVAERDETFMEAYLEGTSSKEDLQKALIYLIKEQRCFPVMSGSALKGIGISDFLEVFSSLTKTDYVDLSEAPFEGKVYKIRHDDNGSKITFIKAVAGKLQVKDEFVFENNGEIIREKVNEIRLYNGKKYATRNAAAAGEVFAVTGLITPICGTVLKAGTKCEKSNGSYYLSSALQSKIKILDGTDSSRVLEKLRILVEEDPMLSLTYQKESGDILVNVMGKIQLEVLELHIAKRFGITVAFEKPQVQYRETIVSPVVGYGHFEPLRHYAEVQLRLEPNSRGKSITFDSECHVDNLALNYQRLIESHVFGKVHRGVLTGSPLTDIRIVLQNGRAHIKHTEGGDFREATYRAIRQGLEKADTILLEPYYKFEIYIDENYIGRVMSDIQKRRGTFDYPENEGVNVCIKGRGPVETFMEYSEELVSFTKGKGSISLFFDGYDSCENAQDVIERIGYSKVRDVENTSSSVFCAKGTSFVVAWDEAENYMHTI